MIALRWVHDNRREVTAKIRKAASEGLADATEFLLEQSNRTVPIEEGTLGRSGGTSVDGLKGTVYWDTPYAVRQHEDTRLRHDSGRRSKWAEQTFREHSSEVGEHIARKIREVT